MNLKKVLITNGIIALMLSLFGFFIDADPRVQNISTNVFEIVMMAFIILSAITIIYVSAYLIAKSYRIFSTKN